MTRGHNDLLQAASRRLPPPIDAQRDKTDRDLDRASSVVAWEVIRVLLFILAVYWLAGY